MIDVLPRKLGHVDESIHAAEVDESTERNNRGHSALADLADLEVGEELVAGLLLVLFEVCPTRKDDVVAVLIEFDDLGVHLRADVRRKIADTAEFDERCGQEATQADVDNKTTLDDFDDRAGNDFVGFLLGFDVAPGTLVLRTLLREKETTFLVFHREHECFDGFTHRDDFARVDVVTDAELAARDHALALVADVQQDFVLVDLDDDAVDHHPVFDLDHGAVDRVSEGHAKVVGGYFARGVVALVIEGAKWAFGGRSGCGFRVLFDGGLFRDGRNGVVGQGDTRFGYGS